MTPIAKYNPNIFKRIQQETLSSYFNREANNNNDEKQMGISKRMSKSPEAFEKLEPIR